LQLFKLFNKLLDEVKLISKMLLWVCKQYKGWQWCEKNKNIGKGLEKDYKNVKKCQKANIINVCKIES